MIFKSTPYRNEQIALQMEYACVEEFTYFRYGIKA